MYEHNALGYWSGLTLCLTKVRSSRARCPATALIFIEILSDIFQIISGPFLQIAGRICNNFLVDCALFDKSMKLGTDVDL